MVYLLYVYADTAISPKYIAYSVQDDTDMTQRIIDSDMLDVDSISDTQNYRLDNSVVYQCAYTKRNEKPMNYPIILNNKFDEAVIHGDCVVCKVKDGTPIGLSMAEKDALVEQVNKYRAKVNEVNEKAEKDGVNAMKQLCED